MTTIPRLRAILALVALALLGLTATASAATMPDATGDASDGDPGHDITQFDWAYDGSGTATGTITVAGQASSDALVFVLIGKPAADGRCVSDDAITLGGTLSSGGAAVWQKRLAGGVVANGSAQRSDGAVTTGFTATDPQLANGAYTCALARTASTDGSVPYDTAEAAASTTPQPTPSPTPVPTTTPPAPQPVAAPALRATLKGVPKVARRGRTYRPVLTVANRGTAPAPKTTVTVKAARGLTVKPRTVKVKGLAAGKSTRVKLRVSVGRRARTTTPLVVSVRGDGVSATARTALKLRQPKPKPKPKPGPSKGGLPGTFWWWNEFTANTPFNVFSLRFYDNGYAYYRLPEDGQSVPDRCTSVTAQPDEDGEYGPGCVKWQLKGGKLTFTDPRFTGTYANGKLEIRDAEDTYKVDKLAEPKAGKRFNFSYQNIESTGICGPFSYCSITKSYLTLQEDGQFGLQEESSSSLDTGGGFVYAGGYPPEARGTYEVLPGYRIRLSYADGKTETVPFGVVDGTSAVDSNVKVVLGRLPFWVPDEND